MHDAGGLIGLSVGNKLNADFKKIKYKYYDKPCVLAKSGYTA